MEKHLRLTWFFNETQLRNQIFRAIKEIPLSKKLKKKTYFCEIRFPWLKHKKTHKHSGWGWNARLLTIKPLHINYINIPERWISMQRQAKVCPLIQALCSFTTSWLRLFKLQRQVVRSPKSFKPLILGWSLHIPWL